MKKWSATLAVALAVLNPAVQAQPAASGPCQAKREDISRSIEAAKAQGQKHRVRGLEKALSEVERNCSDAKLQAEHQQRIERQQKAVAERERDLQQAQRDGDPDKVAKRQGKLAQEQAKLEQIKAASY